MNQFILRLASFMLLVATASSVGAQQQAVVTSQEGNKVYLELDLHGLIQDLNTLHAGQSSSQSALSNLTWSSLLASGTNPGVDVDFFGYDASGLGDVTASGTIGADSLVLGKDALISGRLSVLDAVDFSDSLHVQGAVEFSDSLRVVRSVSIGDRLFVTGVTRLGDSLQVVGNVRLAALLQVDGAATFASTVEVSGETTLKDTLQVDASALFGDSVHVAGNTRLGQDLWVDGNANIGGSVNVSGTTNLGGPLNVTGVTSFGDSLYVASGVDIGGGLSVDGTTNLGDTEVSGTTTLGGDLTVNGTSTFNDTLSVNATTVLNDSLYVGGNTSMGGALDVIGTTTLSDSLSVGGGVGIGGGLNVDGDASFGGTLSVTSLEINGTTIPALEDTDGLPEGATNLYFTEARAQDAFSAGTGVSLSAGQISIDQPVGTTDDVEFDDLYVDTLIASGMLSVNGLALLGDSLNVSGNTHLQQDLQVDGDVNFGGGLSVNGEASFADTVNFAAPALFADSASFAGNVNMAGDLSVSSLSINGVTIPAMDNTDDLPEGATNLYFTDSRAQNAFTEGTGVSLSGGVVAIGQPVGISDDVAFDDLAVDSVIASGMLSVNGLALFGDSLNVSGNTHLQQDLQVDGDVNFGGDLSVSSLSINGVTIPAMDNTDDLPEGATNLYFTDSRAQNAFTEGTGVSLTGGVIAIGQAVGTTDDVAFDELSVDSIAASGSLTIAGKGVFNDSLHVAGGATFQATLSTDSLVTGGLSVAGGVRIQDGNQATGKVLVSDSVGNATWQTAPSAYTAGTGVSITDQVISIGQAVADSNDVAFAKVASDSLVTSALRIQDGNEGAGRLLMSDAEGNASWGTISGSGDLVFTESIQMRGHNTAITKPTMLIDEISLTDDGTGWCTVDMQYAFLDISGAAGGIAESRVFQLPAGYEFDLDYHEVSLGANMLQPENGWGYGGIRGILPDASGWANNNIGDWDRLTVVPYSATEFRVGLVPSGMHSWAWLGQGWYILTDPHYVLLNFRFKKDPPATLATTSTASAVDLGPESATLNGAVVFDGNDVVTAAGFVWGEQADLSDGTSAAGSATSGSFTADLTGLTAGTTYYFTAFVTNAVGTSYGDTLNFTAPYFACSNSSVTYDGVAYPTVSIGDQCWFATNLQTDQYRDGSPIAGSLSNAEWISTTLGAQAAYNNDESNVASFGRLYNWYAASDPRGLCPTGWRVPTSDDFTALVTELGGNAVAGQQLKSSASDSPAWNGTNASGFNGLGGGLRENSSGLYLQVNERGLYWSSTSTTAPGGWSLRLLSNSNASEISDSYSTFGYRDGMSVRCISDDGTSTAASLPIALTEAESDLAAASVTLNGQVFSDGGAPVAATGFVWGQQADLSDGTSVSGSSTAGAFTAALSSLSSGTTYYYSAFATNSTGTDYGDTLSFVAPYFACSNSTVTFDGREYPTVQIGTQCWFAENLQTTKYANGEVIPSNLSNLEWATTTEGATAIFNNDPANVLISGRLYNWLAVDDNRGLCPTGWKVPSDEEWTELDTYLGGSAVSGGKMKSSSSDSPSWDGSNSSGFSAVASGVRHNHDGSYAFPTAIGMWSSTENLNGMGAWRRALSAGSDALVRSDSYSTYGKREGYSVRCLAQDGSSTAAALPIALTNAESDLASEGVTLNGEVHSDGGAPIAAAGFVWGEQADLSDGATVAGSSTEGAFTAALSSLSSGTTYYYSAFATNSTGTDYGDTLSFTTLAAPTVSATLTSSLYSACTNVASSIVSDGNSSVTASGFVVGTQANLSDGTSVTGDLDGSDFTGQLSGLTPGTSYYVSAFATNAAGTGYGDTLSFSTPTFVCGSDELTYDGYAYSTVQIGSQCWFDENLRTTTYSNGDPIPSGLTNSEWVSTAEGAMTAYGEGGASESASIATYGRLYNGFAAQDSRNLCPCGWHVPTDAEFVALEDEVGGLSVAGTALKAASPAWNGTDAVQFNALPGGGRNWNSGEFILQGTSGYWWATDATPTSGWTHQMLTESGGVNRYFVTNIRDGLSIRCVADAGTAYVPQFENLLINGGAESDLDGWTVTAGAVESNTAGQCGSTTQRSGLRFFTVGGACAKTGLARMHQDVSVTAYAADIDAGTYEVRATAWMRNWSAGNDVPEFRVVFLDESSVEISSTPYTSGALSSWSEFTIEVAIPQGTRAIRLELQGTRLSGGDNDSYFDDMTLGVGFAN